MSDQILQVLIIVGGILLIAWPILWLFKRYQDGVAEAEKASRSIQQRRLILEEQYRAMQVEARK